MASAILVFLALDLPTPAGAEPSVTKNVPIIERFSDRSVDAVNPVMSALRAHVPWQLDFNVEHLVSCPIDSCHKLEDCAAVVRCA
jgi:hypothetical protein